MSKFKKMLDDQCMSRAEMRRRKYAQEEKGTRPATQAELEKLATTINKRYRHA